MLGSLLLFALPAFAEKLELQRPHFLCLKEVAALGSKRIRLVSPKDAQPFALLNASHGGQPGYYLVQMGSASLATISFLDARALQLIDQAAGEDMPPALVSVLRADLGTVKAKGSAASQRELRRFASPAAVPNADAYQPISQELLRAVKELKQVAPECQAFTDILPALTDEAWRPKSPAKPTKGATNVPTGLVPVSP